MASVRRDKWRLPKSLALAGVMAVLTLLVLAALLLSAPQARGAHVNPGVVATIPVGSVPLGVGVNPTTNRVYVANEFSNDVSVIDGSTNAVVATVPVGSGP